MTTTAAPCIPPRPAWVLPPGGSAVLLYVQADGQDQHEVPLARLRRYAAARDWHVTAEIVDHASQDLPMARRPEWRRIKRLVTLGEIEGIVTPTHKAVQYADDHLTLVGWLGQYGAWLDVTEPGR